ncbi:histidine kinase dimerization/phospho-acceptor domain-containing protein [Spirulina sp. CS-785/01]|uniref:histidine kinase dimerization/phospho-acceptor domain-containing protein n=1 Tax=Spirulina sp. CS-785/01 TaxID=3021716 RepID=UPI0023303CFC|nr:histidine kinase dimerization/phospho-acceptor domain-containing protein [Spirulina sp. CS-785/01]MDB9315665.1 histidine kinase dimerization/phospho-acceptor domain-containing protein [Spirulina sp. CS-785/01]
MSRSNLQQEGKIEDFEVVINTQSQNRKMVSMSATVFAIEGENCVIGVMKDITERMEVERVLKENKKQLDLFFNNSLEGFFFMMLDEPIEWHDGINKEAALDYIFEHQRVTKINQAMLDQYRAKASNFLGFRPKDFFAHDIGLGRQIWQGLFDRGRWKINTDERRLDGSQMWVEGDYICLYDKQGRITGHFGVQRDITEQRKAAIALSEAKEAAEAAAKAKSEFLANMSHEIRTPMNGVLGMIEVLLQTSLNAEQRDYLQTIQESGDTLLVIINDILDFSKIEAGNLQLDQSEFAIEEVLQSICSLLNSKAFDISRAERRGILLIPELVSRKEAF